MTETTAGTLAMTFDIAPLLDAIAQLKCNHAVHSQPTPAVSGDLGGMPPIMTQEMLAEHLPVVSVRTLEDWRYRKIGPTWRSDEQTRRVFYLKSDIEAWFTANRQETNTNTTTAKEAS